MGYNIEARNRETPSPYLDRIRRIKSLLQSDNAEVGYGVNNIFPKTFSDRRPQAELVRQRHIISAAFHLSHPEIVGFARQHAMKTLFRDLGLAASKNLSTVQEVRIPVFDESIPFSIHIGKDGPIEKEHDIEFARRAHQHGLQDALLMLSNPYTGNLELIPNKNSGTYTTITEFPNNMLFLQAPTGILGIDLNHIGEPDANGSIPNPETWLAVSQLPIAA